MPSSGPHSALTGTSLHEALREKTPVRAASTANVTVSSPGTAMDGVTLASGDRVLLKNQATASQNGIYVWTASASALTRSSDASGASDFGFGFRVFVREGTANGGTNWQFTTTTSPVVLGTTSLTFAQFARAGSSSDLPTSPTVTGEFTAGDVKVSGLTGAATASRYVGATASGPPASGTFTTGDWVVDLSRGIWVCITGGTPGTWTSAAAQSSTAPAVATSGTISTAGLTASRVAPAGAVTGVILQSGTYGGQEVSVINEAVAANSVTFAASGTSHVADGTSSVIAGLTARKFVWDTSTSLWYPVK